MAWLEFSSTQLLGPSRVPTRTMRLEQLASAKVKSCLGALGPLDEQDEKVGSLS